MMRFILPIILIGISIVTFFVFTNPMYSSTDPLNPGITLLRDQVKSYDQALDNSKALKNEIDKLTKQYNDIDPNNLTRLQKLLPENIDNIRLILEIEQIALPYGMALKNIKYNVTDSKKSSASGTTPTPDVQGSGVASSLKEYGAWDLEFSTVGTYGNFLNFTRDLESNLRIVDISSIQFSSNKGSGSSSNSNSPLSESYQYDFKIKTYWLKN